MESTNNLCVRKSFCSKVSSPSFRTLTKTKVFPLGIIYAKPGNFPMLSTTSITMPARAEIPLSLSSIPSISSGGELKILGNHKVQSWRIKEDITGNSDATNSFYYRCQCTRYRRRSSTTHGGVFLILLRKRRIGQGNSFLRVGIYARERKEETFRSCSCSKSAFLTTSVV